MYFSYSTAVLAQNKPQPEGSLPENYADRMFELEATLQYEGSIEIIRELNDHYRAGIDFYIERDSRRATHLQKKMTALLANPDNIRILERQIKKNNPKNQNTPPTEIKTQLSPRADVQSPSLNTRKLKEQVTKFHTVAETCIQNIVQNSNKMADKIEKLKIRDLNKQQEQLNDRIMLKRVKSQEKLNKIKSLTTLPPPFLNSSFSQQKPESTEPAALKKLIQ